MIEKYFKIKNKMHVGLKMNGLGILNGNEQKKKKEQKSQWNGMIHFWFFNCVENKWKWNLPSIELSERQSIDHPPIWNQ